MVVYRASVRQHEKSLSDRGDTDFTEHLSQVRIAPTVESGMLHALLLSLSQTRGIMRRQVNLLGPEWKWLWREVQPFWGYQAANLCCIFAFSALMMCVPLLMRWVIDDILPGRRWGALVIASILFFILYVGRVLLTAGGSLINKMGVQRVVLRLRTRLLERLQSLPASFHARHPVGELVQRLERDITIVGDLGSDVIPSATRMIVETAMTLGAMAFLDWKLAMIVAPLMPIFFYIQRRYRFLLHGSATKKSVRPAVTRAVCSTRF